LTVIGSARGLTRNYGARVAVDRVDIDLLKGEVLGLIGPNGAGKSTLLLLLAGLIPPTSGQVLIDGLPAEEVAMRGAGTVGLVTANPGLYPLLTGRENLRFFGGLYGRGPKEVDALTEPLLAELELTTELDELASTYSSGTAQKVSVARALMLDPAVLLLDEPTSHLDPPSAWMVHEVVRARANAGMSVVLATHDLNAAEHVCDRVAAMKQRLVRVTSLFGPRRAPPPGLLAGLYQEAR
jgi:ABC-2 type transport system ATP-binding protein